ncbi:chromatin modification-related protein eaf-1-like [Thrips palmi]|uniref:Chromatin modification-related protein eaf-1-like n=1 Tax=Thrips palmi TaxID=161013 RepID=A0A6P8ZL55_THRPL|nr:chromatin modification-related protein eaf-1-like [Thrips palmi]
MTRLQVCVAAVAVLLLRGALAQRETMQDGGYHGDERSLAEDMGGSGGLTVQEPPAGWPLSELRAYEHHGDHHHARTGRWEASADTSPWTAVEETEPEAAASESRGSVRWFSATPAPVVAAAAVDDQQSMPAEPGQWYADVPFQQGLPPRQGRVLAANPDTNMNMPPQQPAPAAPEHAVAFFATPQDAEAAAGSDAPAGQPWQPSNSRYKRKRKQNKQIQQQVEQEQMMHHQQQEQQQQQQQFLQQQQPQVQQDDPQLQHEAPPLEVKKTKKTVKRVNKRRPSHTYAPQPQPIIISNGAPGPQGPQGPDPTVSVGYSIGFAAPDGGAVVGGGVAAPPQLQAPGGQEYQPHRGTVQNDVVQGEVVHGEGAVSYSNTLLGNKAVPHQPTQGVNVVNVVSSSAINGRPIYVPPLQQSSLSAPSGPSGPPAGYQPLPTPQALVGSPSPSYTLSVVTAAPSAGPVVVSTTPSYVVRTPHSIFGSGSTTKR